MIIRELLVLVSEVKHLYEHFKVDVCAKEHGHSILRLPPYHCELNPIEMIWSQVKGFVSAENRSFKMPDVEKLTNAAIKRVTPEKWAACVKHVRDEEQKMWDMDALQDTRVEPMIFQVNCGSSDSEDGSLSDGEEL